MKTMFRNITAPVAILLSLLLAPAISAQTASEEGKNDKGKPEWEIPGWELVWHDEFDKDGKPDPKDWNFEHGFCRNHEDQWYQEDNAVIKDGHLIITAKKLDKPIKNPNYQPGSGDWKRNREWIEYTSSSMTTSRKHEFLYGRFEIRAKLPMEEGMWPAFWTVGVSESWPAGGEIDIMEYYRQRLHANVAWQGTNGTKWESQNRLVSEFEKKDPDYRNKWHVFRMEWTEDFITLFVDDVLMNEQDISEVRNARYRSVANPFHQKHYPWINLAIGGDNGGDLKNVKWPKEYIIDYIRIYQKPAKKVDTPK